MKQKLSVMIVFALLTNGCIKLKKSFKDSEPSVTAWEQDRLVIKNKILVHDKESSPIEIQKIREAGEDVYLLKAKEIILETDSELKTEGHHLRLVAEKLIAKPNSKLITFVSNDKAPLNIRGRNGGLIEIQTATAEGQLKIFLNGENGGDGSNGESPDDTLKGKSGLDGLPGYIENDGNRGYFCARYPTEGYSGSDGLMGYPGQDGQAGGDSGLLQVEILDRRQLKIQVAEHEPGQGGQPGVGGEGGAPGDSGRNGGFELDPNLNPGFLNVQSQAWYESCPVKKHIQKPAVPGPRGLNGKAGTNGQRMQIL